MIWQLLFALAASALAVIVIWQTQQGRKFGPFVPSNKKMLRRALAQLPLSPDHRFIDIGSGDGRMVILAAKRFGLRSTGIEIAPLLCWWANIRTKIAGVSSRTTIICGDLYQLDLSTYSIIYIFGLPENIRGRLTEKLQRELKPGTWILSYSFSLPHLQPTTIITDRWRKIMIYRIEK